MRRHDKKIHIQRVNLLFEERCRKMKEDDKEDYHYPFDLVNDKDEEAYELREKTIQFGDDIENLPIEEHHNGDFPMEVLNMTVDQVLDDLREKDPDGYELIEKIIETNYGVNGSSVDDQTDLKNSYSFSDEDAIRVTDRNIDS